ncbi:MAG TPA: protease complex subunit PrcB family protein [Gemmatimonadaceae bacterium]
MRSLTKFALLLATASSFAACARDGDSSTPAAHVVGGAAVPLTRLRAEPYSLSYYSALKTPQRIIVRDEAAWRALWPQLQAGPAVPAIDFSREMVLVVALGERTSGGYSIFVDAASATFDGITVEVRSVAPGKHCGTTAALTQPVDAARIQRVEGSVRFVDVATVQDCD